MYRKCCDARRGKTDNNDHITSYCTHLYMPWKDWRSQVHISGVLNFTICVQNHNKHFSQKPESYKSTVCPINTKMAPQNHKNILCLRNYPNHSITQSCKCKLQSPPTIAILSAHTEFYEQRVDKFQKQCLPCFLSILFHSIISVYFFKKRTTKSDAFFLSPYT